MIKSDSFVFYQSDNISVLEEIVRQQKDSYIIKLANQLKENILGDVDITSEQVLTINEMIDDYKENIKQYPKTCRCICYTNKSVNDLNTIIRNNLYGKYVDNQFVNPTIFNKGEILME